MSHLTDPISLVKYYCPPNHYYIPTSTSHTLQFYRDILLKTHSVTITPIMDKKEPSKIIFHKLFIVHIISLADWRDFPYIYHNIDNTVFNYYDYQDAWYHIFYHQNKTFIHSWFLNFDHKFDRKFPLWFLN